TIFRGKSVGLFATLYCGAFAVIALFSSGGIRSRGARAGLALFWFGFVGSVLPSLVPAAWAQAKSPIALRNPEKLAVAMILGLAIVAAACFDRLPLSPRASRRALAAGGLLAALAAATALFSTRTGALVVSLAGSKPGLANVASHDLAGSIALGGLLWMTTLVALDLLRKQKGLPRSVAVLLLTAVPMAATRSVAQTFRWEECRAPAKSAPWLDPRASEGRFRTLGESLYRPGSVLATETTGSDWAQVDFARRDWYYYTPSLWRRGTVFNADFDAGDLSR